jgi:hypothetical protein
MDTRLRVGRSIRKSESEVSMELMAQLKARGNPDKPPAISTDGNNSYPEAMLETWGKVPEYSGRGRPPIQKKPQPDWKCIQVIKNRSGGHLVSVSYRVVFGDIKEVCDLMGLHTAYIERTHLTSRQMNGRLVRKTLSFSKKIEIHRASCAWEDWVYNLARPNRSLRIQSAEPQRCWTPRSPAMAAGLTDHIWTIKEILLKVVVPDGSNME